jgi:hypothetical protein
MADRIVDGVVGRRGHTDRMLYPLVRHYTRSAKAVEMAGTSPAIGGSSRDTTASGSERRGAPLGSPGQETLDVAKVRGSCTSVDPIADPPGERTAHGPEGVLLFLP